VPEKQLFKSLDEAVSLVDESCLSWDLEKSLRTSENARWLGVDRFKDEICPIIEACE